MAKRVRIGIDFHTWDGIFQGSRSHILGLYRAAIRQAPDLQFVFFLENTDSLRAAYPEFALPNVTLVSVRHTSPLVRLTVQLPWLQLRHGIDLLHMQYRVPLIPVGKTACTIHDILFETYPQFFQRSFVVQSKITFRLAAKMASTLFTVSQFSRGELARLYGVPAERIEVTYNGVDRQIFFPGNDGLEHVQALGLQSKQYVLTVGRLEPRKNQASLIRAWSKLGESAPPLVIVGQRDFSFGDALAALEETPYRSKITLLEKITDAQLPALMRHAAVFAYPAFAEGFGMPVAEAMASGVPVVTSSTTSLPEVAGRGAILIDPHDVDSIHDGLQRALSGDVQATVDEALRHVRNFDWDQSATVLLSRFRAMTS